ncbi:MerR family transcriptional regulator [Nocardiopsis mangrovi]|uniref:MerR family transcriptional regulator n=1 Tax=Nocardiopsis mangrovi TaxID=1179818 RepID=A0ABV9DVQ3_9ACTN
MFAIGDFARLGLVSVRMLRHYDAIGLLRPARTDPDSGYRYYTAGQLPRLNRIVALKDLGFTLDQVRAICDATVAPEELHGMLRLRRAELEERIARDTERLARVGARIRTMESEGHMPGHHDVIVKKVAPVRVAELRATADGFGPQHIGPVIGPLYDDLCRRLDAAGVTPAGPPIAYYEQVPGGDGVMVHAGMQVAAEPGSVPGVEVVDLPAIETAATLVHEGSMDAVGATAQALADWIGANGYRSTGYSREVYHALPADKASWVTELQEPIAPA